jgi:hypothetical protein
MPTRLNRMKFLSWLDQTKPGLSPKPLIQQSDCFIFTGGELITFNEQTCCRKKTGLKLECAVTAKPLHKLISELDCEDVYIELGKSGFIIKASSNEGSLIHAEADIKLPVEEVEKPAKWKPLATEFCEALSMVQGCVAQNEKGERYRPWQSCVHLHPKRVEASDNFHMTRFRLPTGLASEALIRRTSFGDMAALGICEVCEGENWIHFRNGDGYNISCCKYADEEKYPDLRQWYDFEGEKVVMPKGLLESLPRAEIFIGEEEDGAVSLELQKGAVRLTGRGTSGKYWKAVKVKYAGAPIKFNIYPRVLAKLIESYSEFTVGQGVGKVKAGMDRYVYAAVTEAIK